MKTIKIILRTTFILVIISICTVGCVIKNDFSLLNTPGLWSGYKKLSEEERSNIIFVSNNENICKLNNENKIFSINANHLLDCLKNSDSSVVYIWGPNCRSDQCISLLAAQEYCDKNNYNLYVVTEYYDFKEIEIHNGTTKFPLYSINHFFYKTDYCQRYVNLFYSDLVKNNEVIREEKYYRFSIFKKDSLAETRIYIDRGNKTVVNKN
jgi:hypothetical protein